MAIGEDYDSGLPIRTEVDAHERVQVKIVDSADPTRQAQVDTDKNLHVEMHGNNPAGIDVVQRLSQLGAPNTDGIYDGTDNTKPSHSGLIAHTRSDTPSDSTLNKRVTAITGATSTSVTSLDVAIRDYAGEPFSEANPLPVFMSNSTGGVEVLSFKDSGLVAKDVTDTHTYTVPAGKRLSLHNVLGASSGKMRMEVKIGATGAESTALVMFNSTANPNTPYPFSAPQSVPAGENVLVILENRDNTQMALYSTIEGVLYDV
jgi:hypothetical protein